MSLRLVDLLDVSDTPSLFPNLTILCESKLDFASSSTRVVVNFFDGGERDQVTISLDGKTAVPMQYIERTDPAYVRQYDKYRGTSDAFPSPHVSSHVWEFLPSNYCWCHGLRWHRRIGSGLGYGVIDRNLRC